MITSKPLAFNVWPFLETVTACFMLLPVIAPLRIWNFVLQLRLFSKIILEYSEFFSADEDVHAYISTLALPGSWGDNLVLQIVSELLQCRIYVAQAHGVQVIHLSYNTADPIWIAYNGATHYDSVIAAGIDCSPYNHHADNNFDLQGNSLSPPDPITPEVPEDCSPIKSVNSWLLLSANITSFSSQQGALLELRFDIAAVQETRHTTKSQHSFSLALKKFGYHVVWGKPQLFRNAKSTSHTMHHRY